MSLIGPGFPRTPFVEHGRRIESTVRNSGDLPSCHTVNMPAQTLCGVLQNSCWRPTGMW